jgi:mannose-6-phosphate isomerase-like protein (cupin superfamily)
MVPAARPQGIGASTESACGKPEPAGYAGAVNADTHADSLRGRALAPAGSEIVVAEWSDAGGVHDPPRYIAPLHTHLDDDEAWYVLEGELVLRLSGTDVRLAAGGCGLAVRGTPHTWWNPGPGPVRYLLVMTPRLNALIDAIHAMPERTDEAMRELFAAHRSQYLGWP